MYRHVSGQRTAVDAKLKRRYTSRIGRMAGEYRPNPFSNGSCKATCQHSRTVETAQTVGFNLPVPIPHGVFMDELRPAAQKRPPFGLKWRPEITRDGRLALEQQGWIQWSSLCFSPSISAVKCGSQYVKTDWSDRILFKWSSSTIRPKRFTHQHFFWKTWQWRINAQQNCPLWDN